MIRQFREAACPECGGTQGFRYTRTEKATAFGEWNGEFDTCDGFHIERTMPECIDCGRKFRWQTLERLWDADREPQGGNG